MEIRTRIVADFDGRLEAFLQSAYDHGFELLCPPTLAYLGEPSGMNGYAVGFKHPHFLLVIGAKPKIEK